MRNHQLAPTITIAADAWHFISLEAVRSVDGLETGGILLGLDDGQTLRVLHAGGPGPQALRGPRTFMRDRGDAQRLADAAWAEDRSQWIGEWHTHVNTAPIPSEIDLDSYMRHLVDPDLHFDRFIAVIVSIDATHQSDVTAWIIDTTHARSARLQLAAGPKDSNRREDRSDR